MLLTGGHTQVYLMKSENEIELLGESIDDAISELKEKNIETIGDNYTYGAEGYKVIFIHPRSTGGVLLELAERI